MRNWQKHLMVVHQMLNLFSATAHFQYAKSWGPTLKSAFFLFYAKFLFLCQFYENQCNFMPNLCHFYYKNESPQ